MNRLNSLVDGVGTTGYGYDAAGQLLSEDGPWADDTVSYTYNNRLRASLSVLAPNASAWSQSYGYDAADRLSNIASPAGSFTYGYAPGIQNLVSSIQLPSGSYVTNSYDGVARLLGTALETSPSAIINAHQYSYNQGNQRTQQVFTAGNYVNYTYDNIGQLQSAGGKESGGVTNRWQEQMGYGYDAAGNLNWRTNNALVEAFNVNSLNELTTETSSGSLTVAGTTTSQATNVTVNGVNAILYGDATFARTNVTFAAGTNTFTAVAKDSYGRSDTNVSTIYLPSPVSFTYDANGNLTSDGNRCFAYDDENQLVSVWVTNAWRSDFVYDGKMRRRIRREYLWQSAAWTLQSEIRYIYDGNLVIQERDANNLPLVSYTRGRDLSGSLEGAGGIGGLLARTDQSTLNPQVSTAFYHCDGNGNITCLINSKQAIVAKYSYDPYGNVLSQSGPLADANLYRFSSKEFHVASGLVYYLYRFYEPNFQRWPNRDPLGDQGSYMMQPRARLVRFTPPAERREGPNLYAFTRNSPIVHVDRDGCECLIYYIAPNGEPTCRSPLQHDEESAYDCWRHYTNPPHCPFYRIYMAVACIDYAGQGYSSYWACLFDNIACDEHQ